MWELVATAAAGLGAGAGLQAAIAGAPGAAADAAGFQRFAGRSRTLGLLLSTVATSSCLTAYYGGGLAGGPWTSGRGRLLAILSACSSPACRLAPPAGAYLRAQPVACRRHPPVTDAMRAALPSPTSNARQAHPVRPPPSVAESRGALWLAAAAGVGIGIPFNLLLMSPPAAVLGGAAGLEPQSP